MELSDRVALITGAAGGLGQATVRHLAALGMHVVIFDRDGEGAMGLGSAIGDRSVAVPGDVTVDSDVAAAVEAAQAFGALSLVVNVAGGGLQSRRLLAKDGTPHDRPAFEYTMAINALGTFNVSRITAAAMAANEPDKDGQRGVIVNTASLAGIEGQTGQLAYAAAKAAVAGMTLPMARDLGPAGIRVCTIAPGTMATPVFQRAPEVVKRRLVEGVVFPKRMGHPAEFALTVEMIARNPYLNGEVVRLDGALRFPPK